MEKSLWQAEAELSRFDDDAHRLKLERGAYASDLDAVDLFLDKEIYDYRVHSEALYTSYIEKFK